MLQPTTEAVAPTFSEFPPTPYEAWRKAIDKILKGAPFEKRLVTKTYEGIDLQPMYRQEDVANIADLDRYPGSAPYLRGTDLLGHALESWDVAQELPYSTPAAFNAALQSDMARGQNALNLVFDRATLSGKDADAADDQEVGQGGLSISSIADLAEALQGIDLDKTPIYLQACTSALSLTALLVALIRQQGKPLSELTGAIGMDPLGALAKEGKIHRSLEGAYDAMAQLTGWSTIAAPKFQTITVQGHPYHNGGASATQELAFALATGVEYIRALKARGLGIDDIAPRIRFSLSIGTQFFMEIAKFRAARVLWAKIVRSFGGSEEAQKMTVHARTSTWHQTLCDPHVNLLRSTTEAFSAVVGGCNSLHISPFDELVRTPDEVSRRIARNVHTILREESHITRTVDPAGGSWYVEHLTDALARQTWALFQSIEQQGGMAKALETGFPQAQVAETAKQRTANLAKRKDIFVGTNMYPNLKETRLSAPAGDRATLKAERVAAIQRYRAGVDGAKKQAALEVLLSSGAKHVDAAVQAALAGATLGEIASAVRSSSTATPPIITPVAAYRGAEVFEALREAADAFVARTGARPQVFLATMGPLTQHKGRADFATAFLGVGGFETIYPAGFETPDAAAEAALSSGAQAVVICSTDATYPELVPALVQKLKASKPEITVFLAGYPADHVDAFKAAGIDDFIHLNANCHALLSTLQKKMGVAP